MLNLIPDIPMYVFGVHFSKSWVRSLGYDELPPEIESELFAIVDTMRPIIERLEKNAPVNQTRGADVHS
jgi:hypothetical protein